MTDSATAPVMQCLLHFVRQRLRFYGQATCSAGSEVTSSRACYRKRLRAAFEAATHMAAEQALTATVSIGVATSDDASSDLGALLDVADQALCRAKAMDRNRVELWTHSPESSFARQVSGQAA